jgi:hypothetical protein
VRKYSPTLSLSWARQFGTGADDSANAVVVDADGNVYVAGDTAGAFPGKTLAGKLDGFIRKLSAGGDLGWVHQFGTAGNDYTTSVAFTTGGDLRLAGRTAGIFAGESSAGSLDGFVLGVSSAGAPQFVTQFGTSGNEWVSSLTMLSSDAFAVAGRTSGTLFPGEAVGDVDAFVRTFDATGAPGWGHQFGTTVFDEAKAVLTDGSGRLWVVGYTDSALPESMQVGGRDGVVTSFDAKGMSLGSRHLGTSLDDTTASASWDAQGALMIAGATLGQLPGQSDLVGADTFLLRVRP